MQVCGLPWLQALRLLVHRQRIPSVLDHEPRLLAVSRQLPRGGGALGCNRRQAPCAGYLRVMSKTPKGFPEGLPTLFMLPGSHLHPTNSARADLIPVSGRGFVRQHTCDQSGHSSSQAACHIQLAAPAHINSGQHCSRAPCRGPLSLAS